VISHVTGRSCLSDFVVSVCSNVSVQSVACALCYYCVVLIFVVHQLYANINSILLLYGLLLLQLILVLIQRIGTSEELSSGLFVGV